MYENKMSNLPLPNHLQHLQNKLKMVYFTRDKLKDILTSISMVFHMTKLGNWSIISTCNVQRYHNLVLHASFIPMFFSASNSNNLLS